MQIYPAIDLRGGQCVRLKQGDYARETVYGDPASMALEWQKLGADYLHLVDLDGARAGHPVNGDAIRAIIDATGLRCQLGGGLRDESHIEAALGFGVSRVILGTRVLQDPQWVRAMIRDYPYRIVLGLDARDGRISTHGWLQDSGVSLLDIAREFADLPIAAIVFTDIARDGMLTGPNIEALTALAKATAIPVIASGGMATIHDVRGLKTSGVEGIIIGRALYEGTIMLPEAIEAAAG